ncbi:hypothetical protein ACVWW5_006734 [Bradyrhizobium sp. LM3.4]
MDDYFQPGALVMGFIKFTKGASLSDKDRKALQKLLGAEKKKLQSALKGRRRQHFDARQLQEGQEEEEVRLGGPDAARNLQASVSEMGRSLAELVSRTSLRP